jgi:hypothetical protein
MYESYDQSPLPNESFGREQPIETYGSDALDPMPVTEYLPDQQAVSLETPSVSAFVVDCPVAPDGRTDTLNEQLVDPLAGIVLPSAINWEMTDFNDLQRPIMRPGLIINGVKMIRYYDMVEQEVVAAVSPMSRYDGPFTRQVPSELALAAEPSIALDRIANHLRPKTARTEFVGTLLNGQAILLPLDISRAPNVRSRARTTKPQDEGHEQAGMNVLYTGLLRSSSGAVGQLVVEASYWVRRNVTAYTGGSDYLLRGIRVSPTTANMEATLDKQHRDSVENAVAIARYAIRNAYGSGFGMNRRS